MQTNSDIATYVNSGLVGCQTVADRWCISVDINCDDFWFSNLTSLCDQCIGKCVSPLKHSIGHIQYALTIFGQTCITPQGLSQHHWFYSLRFQCSTTQSFVPFAGAADTGLIFVATSIASRIVRKFYPVIAGKIIKSKHSTTLGRIVGAFRQRIIYGIIDHCQWCYDISVELNYSAIGVPFCIIASSIASKGKFCPGQTRPCSTVKSAVVNNTITTIWPKCFFVDF